MANEPDNTDVIWWIFGKITLIAIDTPATCYHL